MTLLGELVIVVGLGLAAVGVGLWVAPGAGMVVAGLGLVLLGGIFIRFASDEEPTA